MKLLPTEHQGVSSFLANQALDRAAVNCHPTTQRSLSLASSKVLTHITKNVKVFRSQTVVKDGYDGSSHGTAWIFTFS